MEFNKQRINHFKISVKSHVRAMPLVEMFNVKWWLLRFETGGNKIWAWLQSATTGDDTCEKALLSSYRANLLVQREAYTALEFHHLIIPMVSHITSSVVTIFEEENKLFVPFFVCKIRRVSFWRIFKQYILEQPRGVFMIRSKFKLQIMSRNILAAMLSNVSLKTSYYPCII